MRKKDLQRLSRKAYIEHVGRPAADRLIVNMVAFAADRAFQEKA